MRIMNRMMSQVMDCVDGSTRDMEEVYKIMDSFEVEEYYRWLRQYKAMRRGTFRGLVYQPQIDPAPLGFTLNTCNHRSDDKVKRQIIDWKNIDLSRQPPLRSHARGIMSRFQMDILDGIKVKEILEKDATFYSQQQYQDNRYPVTEGVCGEQIHEDATIPNDEANSLLVNESVVDVVNDGDAIAHIAVNAAKRKISMKKKVGNLIRRLFCISRNDGH